MNHNLRIFGLSDSRKYAEMVAYYLDTPLADHSEKYFSDGESLLKSNVNVRGHDVYVIQSLASTKDGIIGQKFANLLFFIGGLVDASARQVNLVMPYLGYARQDRKTASREPITTKYVAQTLQAVGVNRILTMDIHNPAAFQNSFYIPTDNLEAKLLIADRVASSIECDKEIDMNKLIVMTPDAGGAVRAEGFRDCLARRLKVSIDLVHHDKRHRGDSIHGGSIIGDVKDKWIIIYDDMMASFKTIKVSAEAVVREGGQIWAACATHGLFVGDANEHIATSPVPRIVITDTVDPFRLTDKNKQKVEIISTTQVFAKAIRRIHDGTGSLSELLEDPLEN